jgi:hypothetical protein
LLFPHEHIAVDVDKKVSRDVADHQYHTELERTARLQADLAKLQVQSAELASEVLANALPAETVWEQPAAPASGAVAAAVVYSTSNAAAANAVHGPAEALPLPIGSYGGSCGGCVLEKVVSKPLPLLQCSKCIVGGGHGTVAAFILVGECKETEWISNVNGKLKCAPRPVSISAWENRPFPLPLSPSPSSRTWAAQVPRGNPRGKTQEELR